MSSGKYYSESFHRSRSHSTSHHSEDRIYYDHVRPIRDESMRTSRGEYPSHERRYYEAVSDPESLDECERRPRHRVSSSSHHGSKSRSSSKKRVENTIETDTRLKPGSGGSSSSSSSSKHHYPPSASKSRHASSSGRDKGKEREPHSPSSSGGTKHSHHKSASSRSSSKVRGERERDYRPSSSSNHRDERHRDREHHSSSSSKRSDEERDYRASSSRRREERAYPPSATSSSRPHVPRRHSISQEVPRPAPVAQRFYDVHGNEVHPADIPPNAIFHDGPPPPPPPPPQYLPRMPMPMPMPMPMRGHWAASPSGATFEVHCFPPPFPPSFPCPTQQQPYGPSSPSWAPRMPPCEDELRGTRIPRRQPQPQPQPQWSPPREPASPPLGPMANLHRKETWEQYDGTVVGFVVGAGTHLAAPVYEEPGEEDGAAERKTSPKRR